MGPKANTRYSAKLVKRGVSGKGLFLALISVFLESLISDSGLRNYDVCILDQERAVVASLPYGPNVERAKAKVALLQEDLEALTVEEFEKRYLAGSDAI